MIDLLILNITNCIRVLKISKFSLSAGSDCKNSSNVLKEKKSTRHILY